MTGKRIIPSLGWRQVEQLIHATDEEARKRTESYEIAVVTEMIGGSSRPGKVDRMFPIRSAAVRGQLRFWWRATRGAAYVDARSLFKQETAIFGSSSDPGPVKIWIEAKSSESGPNQTARLNDSTFAA